MNIRIFIIFLAFFCLLLLSPLPHSNLGQGISPIILTNVELVTVDENSAIITWVTNLPSDTTVQWGMTEDLGNENVVEESENYHLASIVGLLEGTKYFYRIGSGNSWSDVSSFTTLTAPSDDIEIKFAIVADTHYDVDGKNTPNGMMYGESTRLIVSLVKELNNDPSFDFVITDGDLTNTGVEEDFEGFAKEMNKLTIPWYPVLGNHDKANVGWPNWYNNTMGRSDTYYSMDHGGYHFVILDSAVQGEVKGDLDDDQLSWLESDLDENANQPTLLFMHHLPDRTDIFGIEEDAKIKLESILETRPNVLSINSGHIHENNVLDNDLDCVYSTTAAVVSYPVGYGIIKLYDKGYTQSFRKIESELGTSEESRLKLNTGGTDSDENALGELDERSFVVAIPTNRAPMLSSISVDPNPVSVGNIASISILATDPDGDEISYIYDVPTGTIDGSGSDVYYLAPQIPGTYPLTVKVSDGEFFSNEKSIDIVVISTGINHAPRIKNVWESARTVLPEEIVTISVSAEDQDGDILEYHYEASAGSISGNGKEVKWRAPKQTGIYTIRVWVSDLELNSDEKIITITVKEELKDQSDNKNTNPGVVAPGFEGMAVITALIAIFLILGFGFRQRRYRV